MPSGDAGRRNHPQDVPRRRRPAPNAPAALPHAPLWASGLHRAGLHRDGPPRAGSLALAAPAAAAWLPRPDIPAELHGVRVRRLGHVAPAATAAQDEAGSAAKPITRPSRRRRGTAAADFLGAQLICPRQQEVHAAQRHQLQRLRELGGGRGPRRARHHPQERPARRGPHPWPPVLPLPDGGAARLTTRRRDAEQRPLRTGR